MMESSVHEGSDQERGRGQSQGVGADGKSILDVCSQDNEVFEALEMEVGIGHKEAVYTVLRP